MNNKSWSILYQINLALFLIFKIYLTILPVDESIILSALTFFITQTAAITNLIASGGFFIDFTKVISVGFRVFSAAIASI